MIITIHSIIARSTQHGPGERAVLLVEDNRGGYAATVSDLAMTLSTLAECRGGLVTLAGAEVMDQAGPVAELVWRLHQQRVRHIVIQTGYSWTELHQVNHPARPWLREILDYVDAIVDGSGQWIDVGESQSAGEVVPVDVAAWISMTQAVQS